MNNEEVLSILNSELNKGNEVGIFVCKGDGGRSYDIIINGDGQNPIASIDQDNFYYLSRNNYLLYRATTKVGSHWYYGFTKETCNGFTLHKIYTYEDFPFLLGKQFYIVPRGMSKVYYHDELEQTDITTPYYNKDGKQSGYTIDQDYDFTKIKEHATVYTIEKLFSNYMYRCNPFYIKTYCTYHVDVGCYGGRREIEKQNCRYIVEQLNGEKVEVDGKYKEFDLVTIDGSIRYKLNTIFDYEEHSIGQLGGHYTEKEVNDANERKEKRKQELVNNINNYFVTFSIGLYGGGMFSLPDSYYKVTYLSRKNSVKPFEEY